MENENTFRGKNKIEMALTSICAILAVLFFYASFSKLIDFENSQQEMQNQVFPSMLASILAWFIPLIEIVLMFGLLIKKARRVSLLGTLILLIMFTAYIGITMTGVFGRIPCSCGGILENMSYKLHLFFNLFFIFLTVLGLYLQKLLIKNIERRLPDNRPYK